MSKHCRTCTCDGLPAVPLEYLYRPTRDRVRLLHVANAGQSRPGDPGSGMRLYAVRFLRDGSTGQASGAELAQRPEGMSGYDGWTTFTEPNGLKVATRA